MRLSRRRSIVGTVGTVGTVAALALTSACTTVTVGRGTGVQPGSSPAPSPTSTAPQVAAAEWAKCPDLFPFKEAVPESRLRQLEFACSRVEVPLDHAKPDGEVIPIQLIRARHKQQQDRIGSLFINPGGPGGSGVLSAIGLAGGIDETLLKRFDLVGFDPRGVSLSTPLTCMTDEEKDRYFALHPDMATPAGFNRAKEFTALVARTCTSKYGEDLQHYNTVATARDLDLLRQAVGDAKLNYLGFSYGTQLGGVYAHLFPTNVRVAVLDAAVDPTLDELADQEQQLKGFEDTFAQFAAWCQTRADCKALGPDTKAVVADLTRRADVAPIRSSDRGETRLATGGVVLAGTLAALYSEDSWPDLLSAIRAGRNGDSRGFFRLVDQLYQRHESGAYSNLLDAFWAISCNDSAPGPTDEVVRSAVTKWKRAYPLFGNVWAVGLLACQSWQPQRTPPPLPTAPTAPPILVIGGLHDPATPYSGAVNLTKTLGGKAVLLTWAGQGHTAYGSSDCIDTKVETYLLTGATPPPNTRCAA